MNNPVHSRDLPGLYIHVPFCVTKCPYCDFYSITDRTLIDEWLTAVDTEMGFYGDTFPLFDTVYIGGGTPSCLSERQFERLVTSIKRSFSFHGRTEFTCEVNPDDVTPVMLDAMGVLGINRLSVGVQSFDDNQLQFLQRRHTAERATQAVEHARAAGFTNVSIDLMYALPDQTIDDWLTTLDRAVSLNPSHLSCYQLTIGAGTPFGELSRKGLLVQKGQEEEAEFFLATSRFLTAKGFFHYEVSNFSKGKKNRSKHNMKYWKQIPYLGLGPGAHSFSGIKRWWNTGNVKEYMAAMRKGCLPVDCSETLSSEQLRLERIFLGFRTADGVPLEDISGESKWEKSLDDLLRRKLVQIKDQRVVPTRKGMLIADHLPLMFS